MKNISRNQCIKLFKEFVLFSNVEKHCVSVTALALYIAEIVKRERVEYKDLDLDIVFITSLFHDLAKASVIEKLEPEKYGFTPFTEDQLETWQILRGMHKSLKKLYNSMNDKIGIKKHVHETDITAVILTPMYPDLVPYIYQIGSTKNPVYLDCGMEILIMHYADWILHDSILIDFKERIDFLFGKYWPELPKDQKEYRIKKELELEKKIFEGLNIDPKNFNLEAINKKKDEVFGNDYKFFKITKE